MSKQGAIAAGKAFVELFMDTDAINKDIADISRNFSILAGKASKLSVVFGTLAAVVSAPFILGAKHMISYLANLEFTSRRVGVAGEQFARFAALAEETGTSAEAIDIGLKSVGERLLQLKSGVGETVIAFKQLGINIDAFIGAGDNEKRLLMLSEAFTKVKDQGLASGLALRALSEAGNQLLPLMQMGPEKLAEALNAVGDTTATQEQLDAAVVLSVAFMRMKRSINVAAAELMVSLMPSIIAVSKRFQEFALYIRDFVVQHPKMVKAAASIALGLTAIASAFAAIAVAGTVASVAFGLLGVSTFGGFALFAVSVIALAAGLLLVVTHLNDIYAVLIKVIALFAGKFLRVVEFISSLPLGRKELTKGLGQDAKNFEDVAAMSHEERAKLSPFYTTPIDRTRSPLEFGSGGTVGPRDMIGVGIGGSMASQQTLGFAGVSAGVRAQNTLEEIAENTKQTNDSLTELRRAQEKTGRYGN